jgi:hypothetical protein
MKTNVKINLCMIVLLADRGDGLKIWRVAENILNKSRGQPTGGGPPASGFGRGLTTPNVKNYVFLSIYKGHENGRIPWHDPSNGKWM